MTADELPFDKAVSAFKRSLILEALAIHGGNRSRAAAALKIERTSLLRLIRELGLSDLPTSQRGRPPSSDKRASHRRLPSRSSSISPGV